MTLAGKTVLAVVAVFLALASVGCETTRPQAVPDASPDLLAFLEVGLTTRDEVLQRLGRPSGSFEQGTFLTYRIGEDRTNAFFVVEAVMGESWYRTPYSLVLVFSTEGVLRKKNLVNVKDLPE